MDTNLDTYLDIKFKYSLDKSLEIVEKKIQSKIVNLSGNNKSFALEMWFKEFQKILKEELKNELKHSNNIENARKVKNDNYKQELSFRKEKIKLLIQENPKITITKIAEELNLSRYGLTKNKELIEYINSLKKSI